VLARPGEPDEPRLVEAPLPGAEMADALVEAGGEGVELRQRAPEERSNLVLQLALPFREGQVHISIITIMMVSANAPLED